LTNDDIITAVLEHEGGFSNNASDTGGATNWGVTQGTLSIWRKRRVTVAEVKALTKEEAKQIYTDLYIVRPGFGQIENTRLRHLVVDSGVQHGTGRVTEWLQTLLGVPVDGQLGPKTADAINRQSLPQPQLPLGGPGDAGRPLDNSIPGQVYSRLLAHRIRFYGHLISKTRSQAVFAGGWMNRVASFLDQ
jgi:Glycosyl hydrolase 108